MAIVMMPDGVPVEMPDHPTPEQKAALQAKLNPGPGQTFGNVLRERVIKPVTSAASDLLQLPDYKTIFTGTPEEQKALAKQRSEDLTPRALPRELLRQGLDVAGVTAPVLAPIPTAVGVGVDTASRLAGVSPATSSALGTGAELLTPAGQLAWAGSKGQLGVRSRQLVNQAQRVFRTESGAVSKVFEDVGTQAAAGNLALDSAHPAYGALHDSITEAKQLLGPNLTGRKMKIVTDLEDELTTGAPISYGQLEDFHRFLRENLPEPGKVTFSDKLLHHTLGRVRSSLRGAQIATVEGTPLEQPLTEALDQWGKQIVPSRKSVARLETQPPGTVARSAAVQAERGRGIPEVNQTFEQLGRTEALRKPGAGSLTGVAPLALGVAGAGGQYARGARSPQDLALGALGGMSLASGPLPSMVRGAQTPAGQQAILQFLNLLANRAPGALNSQAILGVAPPEER